ncbi:Yip1 domain protein [Dictyocaulus viviparus]|uniref:Protein YIPF n=1 Tax=Dictyocaulus viviparus TaxID=29172 RepID=A0A0D8Y224_DICVI|nr:Yip1 domain protein [Dictyocaulus viviparus]
MEKNLQEPINKPGFVDSDFHTKLGHMMWEAGSKQMKDTFTSYGRIDLFRPYFDVEPSQIRIRIFRSFIPHRHSQLLPSPDLYGPSMVVLTMVALLLFNMKSSGYVVQNGTLMGTSFFACFGSWLLLSGLLYVFCFLLGAEIQMLQLLSIFGYSLTSHCVVLLLTSIYHTSHDHLYFFVLVGIFCVPSSLRMSFLVSMNARISSHRMVLAGGAFVLHTALILYLHFGFHVILEEIDEIIDGAETDLDHIVKHTLALSS